MLLTWKSAALFPRWFGRKRHSSNAAVELAALRFGYLPARFRHRGAIYCVARVERIWEERGRGRRPGRRFFAVSCADASRCTLVHELRSGTWHVNWKEHSL